MIKSKKTWDWAAGKSPAVEEVAGYLDQDGSQLYYVQSRGKGNIRGAVLLCGHFGRDYDYTLVNWNRWARHLARNGVLAMRFDYRGVGESTGDFRRMGLTQWVADVELCSKHLLKQAPGTPLVLHGLGLGALLAGRALERGVGDGLLMWAPPTSAREVLMAWLRHRLAGEFSLSRSAKRMTRQQCIDELEQGRHLDVEGYSWSPELWRESVEFLPPKVPDRRGRPMRSVEMDDRSGTMAFVNPVMAVRHVPMGDLSPRSGAFFQENLEWILRAMDEIEASHARIDAA